LTSVPDHFPISAQSQLKANAKRPDAFGRGMPKYPRKGRLRNHSSRGGPSSEGPLFATAFRAARTGGNATL